MTMNAKSQLTTALRRATSADLAKVLRDLGVDSIDLRTGPDGNAKVLVTAKRRQYHGSTVADACDAQQGLARSEATVFVRLGLED